MAGTAGPGATDHLTFVHGILSDTSSARRTERTPPCMILTPYLRSLSDKERRAALAHLRITVIATGDYMVAMGITFVYAHLGRADFGNLGVMVLLALAIGLMFLVIVAFGWSRHYSDPALTGAQVAIAVAFNLLSVVMFPQMSLIVFIFVFIGMAYGALSLTIRHFSMIWVAYVMGIAALVFMSDLRLEVPLETLGERIAFMASVVLVMSRFLAVTAYVSAQRAKLRQQKQNLQISAEALDQARRQLSLVLQTLPVGVIVVRESGNIRLINDVASASMDQLLGDDAALTWGRLQHWLGATTADEVGPLARIAAEREVAGSGGRRFLVKISSRKDDDGTYELIVVFWDVTAQRRAEFEREQALAFLSHDLRAPLSSIAARLSNVGADLNDQREGMQADLRRASALTEDFLMLAKTHRFKEQQLRSIDLVEVAQEAVQSVEPLMAQSDVGLDLDIGADMLTVKGDWVLLVRALVNLLINAVRHSPQASRISVRLLAVTRYDARLEVQDCGPGFPQALQDLVNADASPSLLSGGGRSSVGLGLLLVKEVMALHRGSLSVAKGPQGGAVVRLTLPLQGVI